MIQTPNVQVQQDFSWLGDVGRVVGGLVQKYPEMRALDQAAKDEKQGKVDTYRGLRQGLERVTQDEELVNAVANDPSFGGDREKAIQYIQDYADRLVPNQTESSGAYHKRAVDMMSEIATGPLLKNGQLKNHPILYRNAYSGKRRGTLLVQSDSNGTRTESRSMHLVSNSLRHYHSNHDPLCLSYLFWFPW
jgi:hypothetical protein